MDCIKPYTTGALQENSNVNVTVSSELALHALSLSLGERMKAVIIGVVHVVVYEIVPVSIVS